MAKRAIRVGLLGESPNDTIAIKALLEKRYGDRIECVILLRDVTGSRLDDVLISRDIRIEYQIQKPRIVVVIRDLDGRENDYTATRRQRKAFFRRISKIVEGHDVPLLNIYSIEALLLTDVEVVNQHYGCRCIIEVDPMHIVKPIEVLEHATNWRYDEGHCRELFPKLDYDRLLAGCRYFRDFDAAFQQRLPPKAEPARP